jgi:hypothetical protein
MTTKEVPTDVAEIWQTAVARYEAITEVKISSLTPANSVEDVLEFTQERSSAFKLFRHPGGKFDKFRTKIGNCLGPIETVGGYLASAASVVRKKALTFCTC